MAVANRPISTKVGAEYIVENIFGCQCFEVYLGHNTICIFPDLGNVLCIVQKFGATLLWRNGLQFAQAQDPPLTSFHSQRND